MKKILVIPQIPETQIKRRGTEIAKHLINFYQVYYLSWEVADKQAFLPRAKVALRSPFRRKTSNIRDSVTVVKLPMLRRPLKTAHSFNRWQLKRFLIEEEIDVVMNASIYFYSMPNLPNIVYCYDFPDLPSNEPDSRYGKLIYQHTEEEVKKADLVSATSYGLIDFIKERYSRDDVYYLPNGTDLELFRSVPQEQINQIKRKYGLTDKFIIGYISYFGPWSNLGFAIDVFKKLKKEMPDLAFLVVGPGEEVDRLKNNDIEDLVFTGSVDPKKVHQYFATLDVGILTSPRTAFRDVSFPIKIVEYTAAHKIAVSTPLSELQRVKFPNIIFASPDSIDQWISALKQARQTKWQNEWNDFIKSYDWRTICSNFYRTLNLYSKVNNDD